MIPHHLLAVRSILFFLCVVILSEKVIICDSKPLKRAPTLSAHTYDRHYHHHGPQHLDVDPDRRSSGGASTDFAAAAAPKPLTLTPRLRRNALAVSDVDKVKELAVALMSEQHDEKGDQEEETRDDGYNSSLDQQLSQNRRLTVDPWTTSSAPSAYYTSVAMSSTGEIIYAATVNGYIYCSRNYGVTWTLIYSGPSLKMSSIDTSSDGVYVFVATVEAVLLRSSDSGASFTYSTVTSGLTGAEYSSISCNSTGQLVMTVIQNGGGVYKSTDYGSTYSIVSTVSTVGTWTGVSVSATGQYVAVSSSNAGIFISYNYGSTWTQSDAPAYAFRSIALSGNGQYAVAAILDYYLYYSSDYGYTWTLTESAPLAYWYGVALSYSGAVMAACSESSGIYISTDYGASWGNSGAPLTYTYYAWLATDYSGTFFAAVEYEGGIILANTTSTTTRSPSKAPALAPVFSYDWTFGYDYAEYWQDIAMSSTGQYICAVASLESASAYGGIWCSSDYGVQWAQQSVTTEMIWISITMSASGQFIAAAAADVGVYVSNNYGASWTYAYENYYNEFVAIASNSTGQQVVCVSLNSYIFVSKDYGYSFRTYGYEEEWTSVASSSSGQYVFASSAYGGVYISDSYATTFSLASSGAGYYYKVSERVKE